MSIRSVSIGPSSSTSEIGSSPESVSIGLSSPIHNTPSIDEPAFKRFKSEPPTQIVHSPLTPLESESKRARLDEYIANLINFKVTEDDPDIRTVTFLGLTDGTPITLKDAMTNKEAEKWISSMKEEMNSMNQNNVFDFDTPCHFMV
jgi:hypothetical protein